MSCLHPCTLPQQAPFADVRRVSPLCAAFCPACECVRDATGKANVAPTCAKNTKSQSSNAIAILRGGAAKWMSFRARAEAKDMELVPTKEPASHLASRRSTGSLPNAVCGQKPTPTTSSQSPLRVYRLAGEGIPRSAPLLLSSKQNLLRWAFVW